MYWILDVSKRVDWYPEMSGDNVCDINGCALRKHVVMMMNCWERDACEETHPGFLRRKE